MFFYICLSWIPTVELIVNCVVLCYNVWEVACKCKTVEGKTIWATFFYQYYPEGDYLDNESDYKSFSYSIDNPLRLISSVDIAHQVIDESEAKIGNIFVLDIREKPKQ